MKNRTVMDHNFGAVPVSSMPRSIFDRSHGYKTMFDCDYLIPVLYDTILPGDTVSIKWHVLIRMASAVDKPFMDNLKGSIYTFFVPYRIIWANFRKHMGEQDNPADSISYTVPVVNTPNGAAGGVPIGHLFDYFGIPTEAGGMGGAGVAAQSLANFAGRAYNRVYHDHFRDQNLQNTVTLDTGDGPDTWANYNLLKINKKFDYFTSCLPYPQKGATAVSLPLGTSATVKTQSTELVTGAQAYMKVRDAAAGAAPTAARAIGTGSGGLPVYETTTAITANGGGLYPTNLYADLTNATAATINSLRQSITLQQFLERDARSGTRYVEIVKSHFAGVIIPDFRAQRSEIIHVCNFDVRINPVAVTGPTSDIGGTINLAELGGFGTGVSSGHSFVHSFNEHGALLSLMVIRADLTYSQGVQRHWFYRTRYDHYWPILANLGEQAVYNREIYWNLADGSASNQKDGVFGYLPRYDEYRHGVSMLTSYMRTYVTDTLCVWNLSQNFNAQPTLGSTFIQCDTPLDRNVIVTTIPHFIGDLFIEQKHARIMPVYAVPGLTRL